MIKVTYKNAEYRLEYNRESIIWMEKEGLNLKNTAAFVTNITLLFQGAFRMNHSDVDDSIMDEIFQAIPDKKELFTALGKMYSQVIKDTVIADDKTKAKNVSWVVN